MSKTGIGDYEYSSAKPHAVEAVDNTSGLIPEGTQSVTYNLWGKVSEVNAVVGSDTYRYELTYGPDLQRVLAVLWKNNSLVHLVTYGRDYEEKYVGSDITRYYYINGTDGNAAVYTSNSSGGKAYCMDMDHLGSITGLYDQYGIKCYGASFDPWGKRTLMSGSIEFDRGFTGHEHIDEINLIDMNGRMYDPNIGRFLSADPFVQAPTNPQNYNRYSYCLNNPLRYTDPSGDFFTALTVFCPALLPIGIAMDIGWMQGAHKASYYPNISTFDGACRGALGGALGGTLSMVGGGSVVANILWGGAEGAITGAIDAALWGEDINRAALNGAIMGATFASFNSLIEASRNYSYGNGFGTTQGLAKQAFENKSRQEAIEKMQDVYGMRRDPRTGKHVKMTYDQFYLEDYGITNPYTGDIRIGPLAFESFDEFKATIVHEYAHSTFDRVLDANGNAISWKYNNYSVKGVNSPLYTDGPLGYANEIYNGGILHIKPSYYFDPKNNLMWDIWSKEAGFKWGYIIPSRYNHTISILDYPF